MFKIIGFAGAALALGFALAWLGVTTGWPVGIAGALALIVWALYASQRWKAQKARDGNEPGAPERIVWQRFAGHAMVAGHMGFSLLNPQYDLHVGSGNYLAIDNWTLIGGLLLSGLFFRADRHERDERDDRIDAVGTQWGYGALSVLVIIFAVMIGFSTRGAQVTLTHFVIGNLLIELTIVSAVVRQAVQLFGYSRDREALR